MALPDKQFNSKKSDTNSSQRLVKSFMYAGEGLKHAFLHEQNFRIHLIFTSIVIVISLFLQITTYEWLAIVLAIGFVLTCELINTTIEATIDLITNEKFHPLAKIAKDVAAAAVVVAAITSVIIGLIIYIPYLVALFK